MMYQHYIAVDWALANMAIAGMTNNSDKITSCDVPSSLKELKIYLKTLKGTKVLTIEETDTSQWLYTELYGLVDKIIICDPYRNHLLKEGAATDIIDARKLVQLLKAGLLKEVFHSGDKIIQLRQLVSVYDDLVQAGVRSQNQKFAFLKHKGLTEKDENQVKDKINKLILDNINEQINNYEKQKDIFMEQFKSLGRTYKLVRLARSVPGIGTINSVKVAARMVDPRRFKSVKHFWAYCGLIELEMMSGGRSYGRKNPRYCRTMKSVFKTAALSCLNEHREGPLKNYYNFLVQKKNRAPFQARHAVARKIAAFTLGTLKSGKEFDYKGKETKLNYKVF